MVSTKNCLVNEERVNYKFSDGVIVQPGDSMVKFQATYDLGMENIVFIIYFREGKLMEATVYSGEHVGGFPYTDNSIKREWSENGYVARENYNNPQNV